MPESMSVERRALLLGLGAELELTAETGMRGAVQGHELANHCPTPYYFNNLKIKRT